MSIRINKILTKKKAIPLKMHS